MWRYMFPYDNPADGRLRCLADVLASHHLLSGYFERGGPYTRLYLRRHKRFY